MAKKILDLPTSRYQKLPAWLTILLCCLAIAVFIALEIFITWILLAFFFMGQTFLNGEHISSIDPFLKYFPNLHLELGLFVITILLSFAWVKWYEKRSITSLGFFKKNWFKELLKGGGLGTFLLIISVGIVYLFGGLEFERLDFSLSTIFYVLSLLPFWFIQGLAEEVLLRAWLLPIINKRSNLVMAIAISSSLLSFLHWGDDLMTVFTLVGLILSGILIALYMLKTDNIWGAAGLHGAWNFAQGNIFGIAVSGTYTGASFLSFKTVVGAPEWVSGGAFGIEGSFLTSFILLIAISILAWQLIREKTDEKAITDNQESFDIKQMWFS